MCVFFLIYIAILSGCLSFALYLVFPFQYGSLVLPPAPHFLFHLILSYVGVRVYVFTTLFSIQNAHNLSCYFGQKKKNGFILPKADERVGKLNSCIDNIDIINIGVSILIPWIIHTIGTWWHDAGQMEARITTISSPKYIRIYSKSFELTIYSVKMCVCYVHLYLNDVEWRMMNGAELLWLYHLKHW